MKEHLKQLVSETDNVLAGRNLAREVLQADILSSLQRMGAFVAIAFHGGTALRFLYGIPRFSEDLDFSLEGSAAVYNFEKYLKAVQRDLQAAGYQVEISLRVDRVVHSAFVRFPGLPYELKLSPHQNETLSIKLEIDSNPPEGVTLATSLVRRHQLLQFYHHDKASLLAGKLHAILQRSYPKGRDFYDLLWYLSDPDLPEPNLTLLNNALAQTDWAGPLLVIDNWRAVIMDRLEEVDWARVLADVRPFLAQPTEIDLLTLENFRRLLLG